MNFYHLCTSLIGILDIVYFMFKQLFIVSMCLHAEFIFFTANLNGENSTLHFNCPVSVWFYISILFKVIFCKIDTLTSRSDAKVSNCFSPIAFKESIINFFLLSTVRWSCLNGLRVMHFISQLMSEENLLWKGWLSLWWWLVL